MKLRSILVLSILLIAAGAFAADDPIHQLDPLGGNWQCKGTAFAFGDMPEHPISAKVTGSWILGNSWLAMNYTETKTAKNPSPMSVRGFFSYDMAIKKFVLGSVLTDRGYSVESSDGWNGDSIAFVGDNHMGAAPAFTGRDTWMKSGKNKITDTFERQDGGSWKKLVEANCTRG